MKRTHVLMAVSALWGCTASVPSGGGGNDATGGATATAGTGGTAGTSGVAGSSGTGGTGAGTGGGPSGGGGASAGVGGRVGAGGSVGAGGTTGSAGSPGTPLSASYFIGADITDQETQPDATRANLLTLMKAHGFNYVRLRTFVDPRAADGYDKNNGFDDITHTVAFGKQVKDAGMGLLVDFHYSDNWADPGKQCVPVAWQGFTTSPRWRPPCTTTPRTPSPS